MLINLRYCFTSKAITLLLLRAGFVNIKASNSPLTKGDPYGYTRVRGLVKRAKNIIYLVSEFVFWASAGRWIVGPSLLVWAEKSGSNSENGSSPD